MGDWKASATGERLLALGIKFYMWIDSNNNIFLLEWAFKVCDSLMSILTIRKQANMDKEKWGAIHLLTCVVNFHINTEITWICSYGFIIIQYARGAFFLLAWNCTCLHALCTKIVMLKSNLAKLQKMHLSANQTKAKYCWR